MKNELSTLVLY